MNQINKRFFSISTQVLSRIKTYPAENYAKTRSLVDTIAVSADQSAFYAWHPKKDFPYEFTRWENELFCLIKLQLQHVHNKLQTPSRQSRTAEPLAAENESHRRRQNRLSTRPSRLFTCKTRRNHGDNKASMVSALSRQEIRLPKDPDGSSISLKCVLLSRPCVVNKSI